MKPAAHAIQDQLVQQSLSVESAREQIYALLPEFHGVESVAIRSALDRHLASAVVSHIDVPSHTNSAMDGYAVRAADIATSGDTRLNMVGSALAGHPFQGMVRHGECVHITTGAVLPNGCDSVVIKEEVEVQGKTVHVHGVIRAGSNIRLAGEDVARGSEVFTAGHKLRPADIGVLASLGIPEVKVKRPVRVAFFSTGDELRSIGMPLKDGEVYDSNRYTLYSMLAKMGCQVIDMGVIADDPAKLRRAFSEAGEIADVIITSGGVSVGDADYVKMVLNELGQIRFWKINMKPGRPLAFGKLGKAVFFGLPGNPVAVMVTFYQFVRPALRRLLGEHDIQGIRYRAMSTVPLKKSPGRTEFLRGMMTSNAHGELLVTPTGPQGSGMLSSMARANCFIVLPESQGPVDAGAWVQVQSFDDLYS
jgi:molybdopterin molybdotransferase